MKGKARGRGAPIWGLLGWGGFAVVIVAALCVSVLQVFRPHPRAGDGKIMAYGLSTVIAALPDADMDKTTTAKPERTLQA